MCAMLRTYYVLWRLTADGQPCVTMQVTIASLICANELTLFFILSALRLMFLFLFILYAGMPFYRRQIIAYL